MTLDSGNIRFVRLFPGVPWTGGVKRQWGNLKRRFSGLSDTDPKIHDLEWPFHVQFLIVTITNRVSAITLHTYCRAIYRIFLYDVTSKDVRKRKVKLRSAEYCGSAKGLRIFRRRKVAHYYEPRFSN